MNFFIPKPQVFRKFSRSSEMRKDALMHRGGLSGFKEHFQMWNHLDGLNCWPWVIFKVHVKYQHTTHVIYT